MRVQTDIFTFRPHATNPQWLKLDSTNIISSAAEFFLYLTLKFGLDTNALFILYENGNNNSASPLQTKVQP